MAASMRGSEAPKAVQYHQPRRLGGNCNGLKQVQSNGGASFICLRNGYFSGAIYVFINKKRDTSSYDHLQRGDSAACTSAAKMDTLNLADGANYNLTAMHGDENLYGHILAVTEDTGAKSAADFEAFAASKIE
ncbi:hypothetical protein RB595_000165 [Gaeumannomyces hyphopodioides]